MQGQNLLAAVLHINDFFSSFLLVMFSQDTRRRSGGSPHAYMSAQSYIYSPQQQQQHQQQQYYMQQQQYMMQQVRIRVRAAFAPRPLSILQSLVPNASVSSLPGRGTDDAAGHSALRGPLGTAAGRTRRQRADAGPAIRWRRTLVSSTPTRATRQASSHWPDDLIESSATCSLHSMPLTHADCSFWSSRPPKPVSNRRCEHCRWAAGLCSRPRRCNTSWIRGRARGEHVRGDGAVCGDGATTRRALPNIARVESCHGSCATSWVQCTQQQQ